MDSTKSRSYWKDLVIPYGRQDIHQSDIDAVVEVLKSDFLTQGPAVPLFEKKLTNLTHASYAVAVNSATSALHIACIALGVKPGDNVWTTPISFVASANCALYCGASIDFVDIDISTYCLSVEKLEVKLQESAKNGRLPKVLIPVHMAGISCDMKRIHELSQKYRFKIIEDASHAIGGHYKGRPVGCCKYSDITVFSFHPVKIVTTGEGGAVLTNDSKLAKKMSLLRSHGITKDSDDMTCASDGSWYYQQIMLGFNYRMTDIQATLGVEQLKRLSGYVSKRNDIAAVYSQSLYELSIQLPVELPDVISAYHLYIILLPVGTSNEVRSTFFDKIREMGIGVNVHYIPIHTQPYYQSLGFKKGDFPVAEDFYNRAITLPLFPLLKDVEIERVILSVKKLIQ
jgi:UDP-4-amino-4,6-dideoxy-N-acetyl-beta-L-altrosamine transaminase